MSQESKSGDKGACHPMQEALLLGLCLLRFGAFETMLYDRIMARLERRERALVAQSRAAHQREGETGLEAEVECTGDRVSKPAPS